jgi:LacI family transcriptional regulator
MSEVDLSPHAVPSRFASGCSCWARMLDMTGDRTKPAGIKEIAKALGISIGTVDRALHGRPDVSLKTRAKVLKMAEQLDYKPNFAARSLKLNQRLRFAIHLPEQISSFFDPLRQGISAAAASALGIPVKLDFRTYPRLGQGDIQSVEADLEENFDGFILAVGNPTRIDPLLRKLAGYNKPVVCVASDAPRSPRLATVAVDSLVSGGIAAELLARTVPHSGTVVPITGDLNTQDHQEKLRGFAGTLATFAPHLHLMPSIESHDSPEEAYLETLALLRRIPHPDGIYINTANSLPVLRALNEQGLLGKIQVVTTDLYPELIPLIESGGVLATLSQRPFTQGRLAFEILLNYLVKDVKPPTVTRLAPHIVLRSNLSLFSRQMAAQGGFTSQSEDRKVY